MIVFLIAAVCCSAYFYIEACKSGLSPRRWALAGLLAGPAMYPLLVAHQRIAQRRSMGFGSVIWYV